MGIVAPSGFRVELGAAQFVISQCVLLGRVFSGGPVPVGRLFRQLPVTVIVVAGRWKPATWHPYDRVYDNLHQPTTYDVKLRAATDNQQPSRRD